MPFNSSATSTYYKRIGMDKISERCFLEELSPFGWRNMTTDDSEKLYLRNYGVCSEAHYFPSPSSLCEVDHEQTCPTVGACRGPVLSDRANANLQRLPHLGVPQLEEGKRASGRTVL